MVGVGSPTTPNHQVGASFAGLALQQVSLKDSNQLSIKSYLICDVCKKVLTESMFLDSIHKNTSFVMFLYSMAADKKYRLNDLASVRDYEGLEDVKETDFCKHKVQARVF